jgi:hypothetical protein
VPNLGAAKSKQLLVLQLQHSLCESKGCVILSVRQVVFLVDYSQKLTSPSFVYVTDAMIYCFILDFPKFK